MRQAEPLQGRRILVVEDDFLLGEALVDLLEDAGATAIGPLGWVDDAIDLIERGDPAFDVAVLDVNLHGQNSYAVADALLRRGIHFVFVTGYDAGALDEAYRCFPRCEKPFQRQAIFDALASLPQ